MLAFQVSAEKTLTAFPESSCRGQSALPSPNVHSRGVSDSINTDPLAEALREWGESVFHLLGLVSPPD